MKLQENNYYGSEANWQFMSVSQYKDFLRCEAAALAKLKGEYQQGNEIALLVGNYVHSYFESKEAHDQFLMENKEKLYSSRKPYGLLKAFEIAEQMIEKLRNDTGFMNMYVGEKEVIVTGHLAGAEWKGKIDCLNVEDGYFVDIKTTKDMHERKWNDFYRERVTFIEDYGYVLQMAVYKELLEKQYGKEFTPIIAAVTKQTPSDIALISINEYKMQYELEELERNMDHILKVKYGQEKPSSCGKCEYCRSVKKITKIIDMEEL